MAETVVGVLRTRQEADAVVKALEGDGFAANEVGMVLPGEGAEPNYGHHLMVGIIAGTLLGAAAGALGSILLPGFGQAISANTILMLLGGAMAGGATGGLAGLLITMAGSTDRTLHYDQEAASGRFVVRVTSERPADAYEILRRSGAIEASPIDAPMQPRQRHRPVGD